MKIFEFRGVNKYKKKSVSLQIDQFQFQISWHRIEYIEVNNTF